ncbi:hypothetical protein [Chryseobacterium sp. WLY505]|uniref:hypothetical protein n=1 Tax=Chryseobacterium sp. WLY505 TaxID=3068892 RepID=UPI002796C1B6|nr:hypothetical protein [Chryseobacterium sp. WLY505]MDQ1855991.1 hypothetical protein [Chryseobacterium sp. WLY505]
MTTLLNLFSFAQVGINTDKPASYSGLHVSERKDPANANPDRYNGIIIQRYTETERDTQLTPNMGITQNSLLIYNTSEDCYNYWNYADMEWKSLCGALGKSAFTFDCSVVTVRGSYVEGRELTNSNFLTIPVVVTKPGEYTIMATTTNGYSFFTSGTFLNTGEYTIQVPGQGKPVAVQVDTLNINANGIDVNCTPPVQVNVMSAAATYTMSCGSATVNGVYKVGNALTASNTITLPVNVSVMGSYTITTNTVDGISFTGMGSFTSIGQQNVTLYGTGTPTSTTVKAMTITSDSQGTVETTCSVNVIVVVPTKTFLQIGSSSFSLGYVGETSASRAFLSAPVNFGAAENSKIKVEGYNFSTAYSASAAITGLNNNPDIVLIGYHLDITDDLATALANYAKKGGVIMMISENTSVERFFRKLYGMSNIDASGSTTANTGSAYYYTIQGIDDEITNGVFGDVRGLYWGADVGSTTIRISNLPVNDAIIYSTSNASGGNAATFFRTASYNVIFVGDGGWLSNLSTGADVPNTGPTAHAGSSTTAYVFAINPDFTVRPRTGYDDGVTIYNSTVFANMMAWAVKKAEENRLKK